MRIHQGNMKEYVGRDIRIFLDGDRMPDNLIEVNDEEGYIILPILDFEGWIMADPKTDGLRQVKVEGVVDITEGRDLSTERLLEISNRVWKRTKAAV